MKIKLFKKSYIVVIVSIFAIMSIGILSLLPSKNSSADSQSFSAGRIIDDAVFTNVNTMTVGQIQSFLNSKVPVCDTYGTQTSELGGGTRAQYAANASLHPKQGAFYPPFTCLKDYTENGLSSAQIIFNTAQQYQINPQVFLVLLQKEQGLITDTWPSPTQYKSATGYGCPDSTPGVCSASYYGLTTQLQWSGKMFRAILNNSPSWYTPYVLGNNYIQYSPDASCGGSIVNIQNRSTQALYNYTPYQPNTATINAPMGSTVSCGAYGNIHFYQYFTQWFGTTYNPNYSWSITGQEVFTDTAMNNPANIDKLSANTTYYFRVNALNTGNITWTNTGANPVNLATTSPDNRTSAFCDTSWLNCQRPAALQQASVPTGSTGTFTFTSKTPLNYGTYNERFNLVSENASWFNDIGMYWPLTVTAPTTSWQPTSQQIYLDSARTIPANINLLTPGQTYYASIQARNNGNTTWTNTGSNALRLGTSSPQDRASSFANQSWITNGRATTLKESSVTPGAVGTFEFTITAPDNYGTYNEYFRPVIEGVNWLNDVGMYWPLTVAKPTPQWSFVSQNSYTDQTMTTPYDSTKVANGTRFYVSIKARNNGNTTWTNTGSNALRLGTSSPQDRASGFYDPSWTGLNRAATLSEPSVAPGAIGTFQFWMNTPYKTDQTTLKEYFTPVIDGVSWLNDIGLYQGVTFSTPTTSWQYVGQSSYTDQARQNPVDLSTGVSRNTTYYATLKLRNTSGQTWNNSSLVLGTSSPQNRTSTFYDSSTWLSSNRAAALSEKSVTPGEVGTFNITLKTPGTSTTSKEYFTPVIEGQTWLKDLGLYWNIKVN